MPFAEPPEACAPEPTPEPEIEGGGGTTFAAEREPPPVFELPKPEDAPPTEGGGGITLAFREMPCPPFGDVRELPAAALAETLGGGGTTSCVPKSLPIMVLTKEPLAAVEGGGGIILGAEEGMPPLSSRRKSRSADVVGGGATTEGAGMLSFAMRAFSRSGADAGGGTTATLFICTREGETACVTSDGAGPMIRPFSEGASRACSRDTRVEAGAIIVAPSEGALRLPLPATFGAGPMIEGSSRGA